MNAYLWDVSVGCIKISMMLLLLALHSVRMKDWFMATSKGDEIKKSTDFWFV